MDEILVEISEHCRDNQIDGISIHIGGWQVIPSEVIVLNIKYFLTVSALIVIFNYFFFRPQMVISEDTAVIELFAFKDV